MAVVHRTTMTPGKLELLASWLPLQPWFEGRPGRAAEPVKAGGFRLDDPEGEVGIEFMVVTDTDTAPTNAAATATATAEAVTYLVPLTYRGAPLPGADHALVGTSEHGVLGLRWIYDGAQDPVLLAGLRALLRGEAVAQDQNESGKPDPTVVVVPGEEGPALVVTRVLRPGATADPGAHVTATWRGADGEPARAVFAALRAG